jgi:hypothetical protein
MRDPDSTVSNELGVYSASLRHAEAHLGPQGRVSALEGQHQDPVAYGYMLHPRHGLPPAHDEAELLGFDKLLALARTDAIDRALSATEGGQGNLPDIPIR